MFIAVVSNMYPDEKHPSYGVFVKNFCKILDQIKVSYNLIVMYKSDSKIRKIYGYIKFYVRTFLTLIIKKYDLIYVHYASHSSIPVLAAAKFKKIKIFTNVHGSDVIPQDNKQERMQHWTTKLLKASEKIVVPSEFFRDIVIEKYNISPLSVEISASGGIDSKVFYKTRDKSKKDVLKIGNTGRLLHKKGIDTLLRACSLLEFPYILYIVGNGPDEIEIKEFAENLKLNKKVIWINTLPQGKLREIYNEIDVFVFPSELQESLGLVAIEAMSCGTPVIASDCGAQAYYVENGKNGYKFTKGNDRELADRLTEFYQMSDCKIKKMSMDALVTAREFGKENVVNNICSILEI